MSFAVAGWARAVTARHNEMPPVPPANRSNRGTGDHTEVRKDARFPQVPATMASSHTLKRQGSFVRKAPAMQTFLPVLLIWITPSFLFVGWRLWMSRPLRDVHYRHRWEYSHALRLARLEGR